MGLAILLKQLDGVSGTTDVPLAAAEPSVWSDSPGAPTAVGVGRHEVLAFLRHAELFY